MKCQHNLVLYSQAIPNVELALEVIRKQLDGTDLDLLTTLPVSNEVSGLFNEIIQANGDLDRQSLQLIHSDLHRHRYDIVVVLAGEDKSQQYLEAFSLARWLGRRPPLVLDPNLNAFVSSTKLRYGKRSWRVWLKIAYRRWNKYRVDPAFLLRDMKKYGPRLRLRTRT